MSIESWTLAVIDSLRVAELPFMIVGSLSSNAWGIPRSTKDADFVIDTVGRSVLRLQSHLPAGFRLDPQTRFEGATGSYCNVISIDGSAFQIELFRLTSDPHDQARFARRIVRIVAGRETWLPTAEDVIVTKLRWIAAIARNKDCDDVAGIIAVQGDTLDWDYIHSWCDRHQTRAALADVRNSLSQVR